MFNFIKKLRIRKKRKEFIKNVLHLDIEVETSFDEFKAFIEEMKDLCYMISINKKDIIEIVKDIPDETRSKINFHLGFVLGKYYKNVTGQTAKATNLVKMKNISVESKKFIAETMEIVHSTTSTVEDMFEGLYELMQIKRG